MSDKTLRELRAEYYQSIRQLALEALERAEDEELGDVVHEIADGSYWVIYTHANLQCIQASDSWLAYDDECGEDLGGSFYTALPRVAYYAVVADINDEIARIEQEREDSDGTEDDE